MNNILKYITFMLIVYPTTLLAATVYESPDSPDNLKPPSQKETIDTKGVDIVTGTFQFDTGMKVNIGSGNSSLSSHAKGFKIGGDNLAATLTYIRIKSKGATLSTIENRGYLLGLDEGEYYKVDAFGYSEIFRIDDGSFENSKQTGGKLSCNGSTLCTYVTKFGDIITYNSTYSNRWESHSDCRKSVAWKEENKALATKAVKADGEVLTYTYTRKSGYGLPECGTVQFNSYHMPSAVMSSLGWMIKYYYSDKIKAGNDLNSQRSVTAINTAIEYCNPNSEKCTSLYNTWPQAIADMNALVTITSNAQNYFQFYTVAITQPSDSKSSISKFSNGSAISMRTDESYTSAEGVKKIKTINIMTTTTQGQVNRWSHGLNKIAYINIADEKFEYDFFNLSNITGPDGSYEVDSASKSRLKSFTDNLGRTTSFEYTNLPVDRIEKVTRPDNSYITYEYDTRGNVLYIKEYPDPSKGSTALITSATYWSCNDSNRKYCNKPQTIKDQNGNTTSYTYYAAHGGVKTITKPTVTIKINGAAKNVTPVTNYSYTAYKPYSYNAAGVKTTAPQSIYRLTKVTSCRTANSCANSKEEYSEVTHYNIHKNLLPDYRITRTGDNSKSLRTDFEYDIYGNLSKKSGPHNKDDTYYFYNLKQQLIGEISPNSDGQGRIGLLKKYNADGKVTQEKTGTLNGTTYNDLLTMSADKSTTITYNSVTGLAETTVVSGRDIDDDTIHQMSYDRDQRLICKALRINGTKSSDACSANSGVFGDDRITKNIYNEAGELEKVIDAFDTNVQRVTKQNVYNNEGQLYQVKDGNGNTTQYRYDGYGRLERTTFPSKTSAGSINTSDYIHVTYQGSLLKTQRLRNGTTITFTYDNWNRKTRATSSSNSTFGRVNESFGYDNFNNLTSHTNTSTGISSQTLVADYNALGWKKYETTQLGKVSYSYDDYGRRNRLTWPDNFYITYDYGSSLLLKNIKQQGSTVLATYSYDDKGRKDRFTRANGVTSDYVYDDFSRLNSIATDVGGSATSDDYYASFIYNPASQVIEKGILGNQNYEYTKQTESNNYTPNGLNQITNWSGTSIGYDTNGNLKSIGTKNYVYNNDNLLISANGLSLKYDTEKRLYKIGTTCFLYDEQDLIAETNCSGTVLNRYIHGDAVDDPIVWYQGSGTGTKRFYTEDHNGSVIGITNSSGTSYAINSYDEYGIPEATNVGRFQFTGQVWLDEIDLYYYKARIYHPKLGRFLQTDPIGYEDQMNLYAYVHNDPINLTDPSGKSSYNPQGMSKDLRDFDKVRVENGVSNAEVLREITGVNDAVDAVNNVMEGNLKEAAVSAIAVACKACKAAKMQQKVKKGQAPDGIKRFDSAEQSVPNSQDHVHLDNGTSMNVDGTVHDKLNGTPKFTNKQKKFLKKNGWPTEVKVQDD